jgi:hypothetical protein
MGIDEVLIRSPGDGASSRRNTGLGLLQVESSIKRRQPGTLGSRSKGELLHRNVNVLAGAV